MATGNLLVTVDSDQSWQHLRDLTVADNTSSREQCRLLAEYFTRLAAGNESGRVNVAIEDDDGTQASGTITCTQLNAVDGDTVTICGVTFTVRDSPSTSPADGEFLEGASNTAMAANLSDAVNAHPALKGLLTSSPSVAVVTCTMATAGVAGNVGTLSETGTSMVVSAARFASGAVGTERVAIGGFQRGKA